MRGPPLTPGALFCARRGWPRRDGEVWRIAGTYDESALARAPPFEAAELPVGRLFPPPPTG